MKFQMIILAMKKVPISTSQYNSIFFSVVSKGHSPMKLLQYDWRGYDSN